MGSAKTLSSSPIESSGRRGKKRTISKATEDESNTAASKKTKESKSSERTEEQNGTGKRPKRGAAATSQQTENSISTEEEASKINRKQIKTINDELLVLRLTSGEEDKSSSQIVRRLTNFTIQDGSGDVLPLELVKCINKNMLISGTILPLEDDKENHRVECIDFGPISACKITGYTNGSPVIVLSTGLAEYKCIKPSTKYKKLFNHFYEKACACVEIYKQLLKSVEGNSELSLDELLAGAVRSLKGNYPLVVVYSREFLISTGEFIFDQISDLEESQSIGKKISDFSALVALLEESRNREGFAPVGLSSNSGIKINDAGDRKDDDDDANFGEIWQEIEYWNSVRAQRKTNTASAASNAVYIKINEDEFADDYPLPSYYKHSEEEIDEYIAMECEAIMHPDDLPKRMLHNWALYNSDSRLISLELLPMKPCERIDVTIFGSGSVTVDDGSGFCIDDDDAGRSSAGDSAADSGLPVFLSDIKEWVIELGPSMVFVSIRTDMAWYRLGKPSKQYALWYKPVLKTAKVAMKIISLLKEESRVSKLSFSDVMKKLLELEKSEALFCSSNLDAIERFVVVHGQIILQLFAEFPDKQIKTCAFYQGLKDKMEYRHHTKWVLNKRNISLKNQSNLNPRALMTTAPPSSKRKAMEATITLLIKRIWGEFYSNHTPEEANKDPNCPVKEEDEAEEQDENEDDDIEVELDNIAELHLSNGNNKSASLSTRPNTKSSREVSWDGKSTCKTDSGDKVYERALVNGLEISVGQSVALESTSEVSSVFFVEYMFETSNGKKHCHGRRMMKGNETVLNDAANELEYFLTNECEDFELAEIKQTVSVEILKELWGHQHRKSSLKAEKLRREKAKQLKKNGLPLEYFCKSVYASQMGAFVALPYDTLGLGSGSCCFCSKAKNEEERNAFHIDSNGNAFRYNGTDYKVHDFVYLSPFNFYGNADVPGTFKGGRNIGSRAYVIGQILSIIPPNDCKADSASTRIKIRRFFRPEDVSSEKAYSSDVREIYYSEETDVFPVEEIEGKCEVRRKSDVGPCNSPALFEHVFYCECVYDPQKGSLKQLPANVKLKYSSSRTLDADVARKKKGKAKIGEAETKSDTDPKKIALATLDIFAGCGGLSEGLQQADIACSKWAIELDEPAGEAFKLNHPQSTVFTNNCNVILRAIMDKCGDSDDCISTKEATEKATSLDPTIIDDLPLPGQVEFISGGPPCQGFSGMNRFNQSAWSKVQCEMILAFLSFADYFRPRYFLLENVRNFVSFNKGHTFRLTLASLLEMGYQVRFGILEAGAFGVAQSRKRAFIWAASPDETLPEWPEPMHVFAVPELKITLSGNSQYAAVRSTAGGAPFRAITVRDTIGDLPSVGNGASDSILPYGSEPTSWFQKKIRGNTKVVVDHISKEMNELNLIRCKKIPKRPGADWHDLPDEKITLSTGQVVDLIPWCLPNTAKRHNEWKGLFGRLDWEGNFPTSITDPQPMGKVGMCFHPDQDRIVTVRECARSQGFPDCYEFSGNIHHKHRQIGNAVPPPLAYALGVKLKKAVETNCRK